MTPTRSLKILLVEDEALIAMMAEDMIETIGHVVVQTAATLAQAETAAIACGCEVALLDVNLNGDSSMSVAALLKARGCPLAFTTGYGAAGIDSAHADVPVLTKPYSMDALGKMLDRLGDQLAGTSSTTSVNDSNRG